MFKNLKKQIQEETGLSPPPLVRTHHRINQTSPLPLESAAKNDDFPLKLEAARPADRTQMELSEVRNRYAGLEKTYEDYRSKTIELLTKKDSHITKLQQRISTLEGRIEDLQESDRLHSLLSDRDLLEQKVQDLEQAYEAERSSWARERQKFEDDFCAQKEIYEGQLVDVLQSKDRDIQKLREGCECDLLRCEIERLNTDLNAAQHEMSNVREKTFENEKLRRELGLTTSERDNLLRRVKELETQKRNLFDNKVENYQLRETLDDFESMDIQSEQEITSLSNQVEDLHEELNDRHRDLNVMNNELTDKDREVDFLSHKVKMAEVFSGRQGKVIENLRDEVDQLKDCSRDTAKERDDLLLRNASLSHELELLRRETSEERQEMKDQIVHLRTELDACKKKLLPPDEEQKTQVLGDLSTCIADLEEKVKERDVTIRLQQQRLADMKKTLQKEFRAQSKPSEGGTLADSKIGLVGGSSFALDTLDDGHNKSVNFQYMKNVLLRFMTSSDYEAMQLIRAVSTILHLSEEEERLVWGTLRWKMSWLPVPKPSVKHS